MKTGNIALAAPTFMARVAADRMSVRDVGKFRQIPLRNTRQCEYSGHPVQDPGVPAMPGAPGADAISWNEGALQPYMLPVTGDVLITLDRFNQATMAYWSPSCELPRNDFNVQGAWVIKLCDIHTTPPPGVEFPVGFPECWRCLWVITWKFAEGVWGLQGCADLCVPRLVSLPEDPGLGRLADRTSPSSHNLFVNLFMDSMRVSTPMLQVEWWVPVFDSIPIPNSWVLGIWDCPTGDMALSRTLSSWHGGRGSPWHQGGVSATCIIPRTPSAGENCCEDRGHSVAHMEQHTCTTIVRVLPGELSRARATLQPAPAEAWTATQGSEGMASGLGDSLGSMCMGIR